MYAHAQTDAQTQKSIKYRKSVLLNARAVIIQWLTGILTYEKTIQPRC